MYKIAVIGDRQSIAGFASLGLSVFETDSGEKTSALIKQLADNGFAVIYITEHAASGAQSAIEKYRNVSIPAIIPIPGTFGNTGEGQRAVHTRVEKAVGSDILSK